MTAPGNAKEKQGKREKKPPKKITPAYLHNSGLYYLQRFSASTGQFRDVMLRKAKNSCYHHKDQDFEACKTMIDELVKKVESAGLLNDTLYTQGVVASLRRQGKSRRAIMMKLAGRKLDKNLIAEKLGSFDDEEYNGPAESETAAAVIFMRRKRLGPYKGTKDIPRDKALSTLARAGFCYDIAQRVLDMNMEEAENFKNI